MIDQQMTEQIGQISLSNKPFPSPEFTNKLEELVTKIPFGGASTFSTTPVIIDEDYIENSHRLCQILNSILVMFAYNYSRDERLQQVYQLDKELNDILMMAEGIPYEIGMYRPDFVFDLNGQRRICEIGCRYPVNGWLMSGYLNQVSSELAGAVGENFTGVEGLNDYLQELGDRFDEGDTVFLVRKDPKRYKQDYLLKEFTALGITVKDIQPEDLTLEDGNLKVGDEIARQFFLEMDREELKTFDPNVLNTMIKSGRCLNDVRTLILVHDKRVLCALYNQQIMASYVNQDDYKFLLNFLIPSFIIGNEKDQELLINSPENWVLKKNSGGRGIDMYIKSECDKETWDNVVKNHWSEYMVQPYVQQKQFELTENDATDAVSLVGLDLYFNGRSFGPGLFRASTESTTNVNNGKSLILPCLVEKSS
jgi:hypothetical protein